MKKDQSEAELPGEGMRTNEAGEVSGDDLRRASEIEQIDDSQLPQSIKDLFRT